MCHPSVAMKNTYCLHSHKNQSMSASEMGSLSRTKKPLTGCKHQRTSNNQRQVIQWRCAENSHRLQEDDYQWVSVESPFHSITKDIYLLYSHENRSISVSGLPSILMDRHLRPVVAMPCDQYQQGVRLQYRRALTGYTTNINRHHLSDYLTTRCARHLPSVGRKTTNGELKYET
jgi:hypothetical protein